MFACCGRKKRGSSGVDYYQTDTYKAQQAKWKFEEAQDSWRKKCADQLFNATKKNAARKLMLYLSELAPVCRNWQPGRKDLERSWPLLKQLFNEKGYGTPLAKAAVEIKPSALSDLALFRHRDDLTKEVLDWIGEQWGVEFDEPPKWEDYEYKPAEKKGGKAAAAKQGDADAEHDEDDDEE